MPAAAGEASAAAREAAATQNLLRDLGVAAGGETASKPPRAPMTEAEAALVIQRQLRMRTAKRHVRARAKRKAVRDAILAVEAATHHQPPRRRRHGAAQASGGEAPKHDARRRRHARGATEAAEGQQAGAKHGAAGAWESEQACAALRVRHAAAEAEVAALRGAMDGQRRQPGAKHMEDTQEADHRQATQEAAEERRREHALVLADQQERATAGAVEHQAALQRLQADMERREDSAARRLRLLERRAERDRRVWGDEHADEMGQMQEQVPPRAAVARATRLALHFRRPSDASLPPGRCIAVAECRKQPSPPDGDGMTSSFKFTTVDRLQFLILGPVQPTAVVLAVFAVGTGSE
jgi:hypothetical protein